MSLFSGAGIGDVGFRAAGIRFLAMVEIDPPRADLCRANFPEADVRAEDVHAVARDPASRVRRRGRVEDALFLVTCTAPCQGMSKSGQGKLLSLIRKGQRPSLDPRNRLVLPALRVIARLKPKWAVFENVVEMRSTTIEDARGRLRPILEVIRCALQPLGYCGEAYDVECADFGVPQRRRRLITVYTRDPVAKAAFRSGASLIPRPTHSRRGGRDLLPWVSVSEALRGFPRLDAQDSRSATCDDVPLHRVPVLDAKKYSWVRHTPPGASAFDNQCVNPKCRFGENAPHGSRRGRDGVNRAAKTTPLHCERCGELLPRPYTELPDGSRRLMSGYTSAYKRMAADLPAPTLTRNLSYPCSDHKVHPFENRVLSLAEAIRLHTLDRYDYEWGDAPDSLIRLVLGESVPPAFLHKLGAHLASLSYGGQRTRALNPSRGPRTMRRHGRVAVGH